jgi:hypothetical protein
VPYRYEGQPLLSKLFVTLCNEKLNGTDYVLCLKATSQTALYENSNVVMAGCVFYKGGELALFPHNTAIQPDNPHPIPYAYLIQCHAENSLTIVGTMPADFRQKLTNAIQASIRLTPDRKQHWLSRL